ncbi:hypothetical protein VTN77DRAFT_9576 [Rasamsonia byssochlamydoides]|uniref:uncharacterized protein n=1 Tax=Rasamsonia byssochlamydoides TaxID=89139 RepID=UPI003743A51E
MTVLGNRSITGIWTMWMFTVISFICVTLRLYTRICLVHNTGPDDYAYCLSWILLLLYTIFITIAAVHGFGRHIDELSIDDAVAAVYYEMVSQTFAVIGMAVAKISLGLFLLRIVVDFWQKVVLWFAIVSIAIISLSTDIIFWLQCIPSAAIYDPRVKGVCHLKVEGVAIALGSWCVVEDFFLAAFPWYFIWGLNMKRKEKLTLAGGLSLGVIAGICGIFRTISLGGFHTTDYPYATFDLIVWSGAEICLTLLCIGIPVMRPLYKVVMKRGSSRGYYGDSGFNNIEGGERLPSYQMNDYAGNKGDFDNEANVTSATRGNVSEERILGPEYEPNAIRATKEVTVTYSNRKPADDGSFES